MRADWWFTTPTVFLQPATGWPWPSHGGLPWSTPWLAGPGLYLWGCLLAARWCSCSCDMAQQAEAPAEGSVLPAAYWRCARWWEGLGYPAFVAMAVVFFLMVNKTLGG